jgi:hypothetical protein
MKQMRMTMRNLPSAMLCVGSLMLVGALLAAPLTPASAGYAGYTYETYKGAHRYARTRARKVCQQERDYRALEWRRLAQAGVPKRYRPPPWTYASPWGACTAPGLF